MRIDKYLLTCGLCESRTKAQNLISENRVIVNGNTVSKASFDVSESDNVEILKSEKYEFVGRGGEKLEHAIKFFSIAVKDKLCVDIGASTGGFTECLLLFGAKKVYAIDSGINQLHQKLKNDDRVVSMEGVNARGLTCEMIDDNLSDIVVMDVSFISQKLLYPAVLRIAKAEADIITLVKPQFEVGKQALGKKGIVKDEKIRRQALKDVIEYAKAFGFEYIEDCVSPIKGGDGNEEFLLHLRKK